jgi:hypothetical protein
LREEEQSSMIRSISIALVFIALALVLPRSAIAGETNGTGDSNGTNATTDKTPKKTDGNGATDMNGSGDMNTPTDMNGEKVDETTPGADASQMPDTEGAIRQVPTYEEPTEQTEGEPSPQDTFYSLAEDYIFLSDIGGRRPGRVPIWPRGAMHLGPVQIFPYLEGRLGWTNNVFDTEAKKESWFVTEGGGVAGKYAFLGGRANVTFGGDYRHFNYFSGENISYSQWTAGIGASYSWKFGLWVKGGVKWEHLVDPVDIQFAGRLKRDQFYPYVNVGLDNAFGRKVNVEVGVSYFNAQFAGSAYDTGDRRTWDGWLKASYPFYKETTRLFVRYDYFHSYRQSDRLNDLKNGNELSGGIEGTFPITHSERLRGELGLGYRRDLYGAPRNLTVGTETFQTDSSRRKGVVTVHASLEYLIGAKTSADLRLLRTLEFSPSANYEVINRADLDVTHNVLRNLVARAGVFIEYSDQSNSDTGYQKGGNFTRFGGGLGARYLLLDNADVDLSVDWSKRNTSRVGYDTDVFTASLGFTYYFGK